MVTVSQQLVSQQSVVGQLSVETKAEPLSFMDMMSLERLGIITVILSASRVSDVADRGGASHRRHQRFDFGAMVQPKDFGDRTDVLHGFQHRRPIGIVAGHASGQLSAILNVQQHSRQQAGDLSRAFFGAHRAPAKTGEVINGRYTTFVMDIAHIEKVVRLDER